MAGARGQGCWYLKAALAHAAAALLVFWGWDTLLARCCLSSPCSTLRRWHRTRSCPRPGLCRCAGPRAGCTSSCCRLQAPAKTPGHLHSYCRSGCCSLHSSLAHLYRAPPEPLFLELTPSPGPFQERKDRSTACLCGACAAVCKAVCGVRVQGTASCLPRHRMPFQPPNPHVPSNHYPPPARKQQVLLSFLGALT